MNSILDHKNSLVRYTENGITYRWNVTTLWKAAEDGAIEEVMLSCFDDEFEHDRWFQNYKKPTVNNMLRHFERLISADLSFPIIISPKGRVLDGIHRIAKAQLDGLNSINAIRLRALPPSDYYDDTPFLDG